MPALSQALVFARENNPRYLSETIELLKISSVSTDPEQKEAVRSAAHWLMARLEKLGAKNTRIFETPGHPIVYGEIIEDAALPTILVYGHYDVQPADPLELWTTGPFDPVIRGEYLFARGASDMKGQVMAVISALDAIRATEGSTPVNVKFILEGEEEIGSPNLSAFIESHKDLLKSDVALNPDTGMISARQPTIVTGLRGLAYFELKIFGPKKDLHSGVFGGVVQNPAIVLCDLISGMHTADGKITLPGFYDRVAPISKEESDLLATLNMDEAYYQEQTGVKRTWGEAGYPTVERTGSRPTLDVNGIYSGFIGAGSKTVIPAYAMAKISMRLVPYQDPAQVKAQLIEYIQAHVPDTVTWELIDMAGSPASYSDPMLPYTQALARALTEVWSLPVCYKREGGSVPVVGDMQRLLGMPSVLSGFGLPDDNIHSPNEKLHLPTWQKGIEALVRWFYYLREVK